MEATRRLAQRAARRALGRAAVRCLGGTMLAGATVGLASVGVAKLAGWQLPWVWPVGGSLLAGAVVGLAWAWSRRLSPFQAAAEVDRVLGTNDRLASGLMLEAGTQRQSAFAAWAGEEADDRARTIDVERIIRPALGWRWLAWPAVTAGAIAVGIWAPVDPLGLRQPHRPGLAAGPTAEEVRAAAADLAAVVPEAPAPEVSASADPQAQRHAEELREIERQLMEGKASPQQARQQAATTLEAMAADAERRSKSAAAARDALRDRLARTQATDQGSASDLQRAIRSGDAAAVREAVERLSREAGAMSPEDRAALAEQLDEAARRLEQAGAVPEPEQAPRPDLPPDVAGSDDPQRIEEALRQAGADPSTAASEAQRLAEQNRAERARREAERQAKDLSDAMRDAANELRQPAAAPPPARSQPNEPPRSPDARPPERSNSPQGQPQQPKSPPPPSENEGGPKGKGGGPERPSQPPSPGTEPSGTPSKPPGERPGEAKSPDQPSDRPNTNQGERPGNQPAAPDSAARPSPGPADAQDRQPAPANPSVSPKGEPTQPDAPRPGQPPKSPDSSSTGKDQQGGSGEQPSQQPTTRPKPEAGQPSGSGQPQPQPGADKRGPQQSGPSPGADGGPSGQPRPQPVGTPDARSPQPSPDGKEQPVAPPQGGAPQPSPGTSGRDASKQGSPGETGPRAAPGEPANQPTPGGTPQPGPKGQAPGQAVPQPSPDGAASPGQQPEPGSAPTPGMERLLEQARRMADRSRQPQQDAREAEQLREQARRMLEGATPEEREQWRRLAEQMARERRGERGGDRPEPGGGDRAERNGMPGGGPGDEPGDRSTNPTPRPLPAGEQATDVIDARRNPSQTPAGPERVVAEWMGKGRKPSPQEQAAAASVIREAAASGQKAVEDRTLPSRYDGLLRRYFRRLPEQLGLPSAGPAPGEPVPAKDAPR